MRNKMSRIVVMSVAGSLLVVAPVWADGGSSDDGSDATTTIAPDTTTAAPETTIAAPSATATATSIEDGSTAEPSTTPDTVAPDTVATDAVPATTTTVVIEGITESGIQSVTVDGTAIAIATTGANASSSTPAASGAGEGSSAPAAIGTGDVTAVGSRDLTTVQQVAATSLTDQATADITQVVLVFNVGGAVANSGANGAGGSSGGGASGGQITTGAAQATGNSAGIYITQAATADASMQQSDSSAQFAVSVRLGIAYAGTGSNSTTGGAGASAGSSAVQTGPATAIGNDSITDVLQAAVASGSGNAHLTVNQRAVIVNLGLALANSGLNDIGSAAGALLEASDDSTDAFVQLLLPTLMSSYMAGLSNGGGQAISTGSATAVGNQSATYVSQSGVVSAAGDGSASIDQQVVVANVGVAVADSGLNNGAASPAASMPSGASPQLASAIDALAQQLSGIIDQIVAWSRASDSSITSASLSIPIGDMMITIDSTLTGTVVDTVGVGNGTSSRVRQMTAVVSLGVSSANSGNNTLQVQLGSTSQGIVANGQVTSVTTGSAAASNSGLVIICQLDDAADSQCLAPPETVPTPVDSVPADTTPAGATGAADQPAGLVAVTVQGSSAPAAVAPTAVTPSAAGASAAGSVGDDQGRLPATGADVRELALGALFAIFAGGFLSTVSRRRRTTL